ncbi:MAG: hypothetical protein AVDCRST_MAG87-2933, partial [uncultured Thermomicrobiales bacterium]
ADRARSGVPGIRQWIFASTRRRCRVRCWVDAPALTARHRAHHGLRGRRPDRALAFEL